METVISTVPLTTMIVTRARPDRLQRAIESLQQQQGIRLFLVVVIDDCQLTLSLAEGIIRPYGAVKEVVVRYVPRNALDRSGPRRVAALRNLALGMVATPWCSFLDDDNELEPHHLCSVLRALRRRAAPAAHSWRTLWTSGGKPFRLSDAHPWCRDQDTARQIFQDRKAAGIYRVGSNVVRDQVVPHDRRNSMVDTSEWIFRTDFLRQIRFVEAYSEEDWLVTKTEDSKLLDKIVQDGYEIPSTRQATLRYYLGGYSNNWLDEAARIEGWR